MRDINTMLEELGVDALKFEGVYLDTYKREKPMFSLPEPYHKIKYPQSP